MIAILVVTMILAIVSITLLFIVYKDIRMLNEQMDYKNKTQSHFEICIQSDLSEMKELQKNLNNLYDTLEKNEESRQRKEKEMQTLISGISHDIRTPLTSIQGYLQLIKDTKDENEKKKYFETVEFRLESLKMILEDLFIHSKISDDEYQIAREEFEVYPLICKILASFYYEFTGQDITPIISFSDKRLLIKSNKELFIRMIQNLINNALQHGETYFEIKENDGMISFINDVSETKNMDIDRLFDRFYKADVSRHHESTGLGLSIVKKIAEINNWTVSALIKNDKLHIVIDTNKN